MGFIKAMGYSAGGAMAEQWQEFYGPAPGIAPTVAVYPALKREQNAGRGVNEKGSNNVITNGSKIIVPEGTALITIENGGITGVIAEPGGFVFSSDDPSSQSVFEGRVLASTFKESWKRFKAGGQPTTEQLAFYVNLKEIPNNKFGTQSEIYWDDAYFGTQVGAMARGTYSLRIVDPLLFVKNFLPPVFLQADAPVFDFADMNNDAATQLFNEVVGTLSAAFANYTNDPSKGNRMSKIQSDQIGFAQAMAQAVEDTYHWKTERGIEIVKTAILSIEYDKDTQELMKDVKRADALSGARGNAFMQQAAARGIQAAGESGGGAGMAFMGMGVNATGGTMGMMQQPATPSSYQPAFAQGAQADPAGGAAPGGAAPAANAPAGGAAANAAPVGGAQTADGSQGTQPMNGGQGAQPAGGAAQPAGPTEEKPLDRQQ